MAALNIAFEAPDNSRGAAPSRERAIDLVYLAKQDDGRQGPGSGSASDVCPAGAVVPAGNRQRRSQAHHCCIAPVEGAQQVPSVRSRWPMPPMRSKAMPATPPAWRRSRPASSRRRISFLSCRVEPTPPEITDVYAIAPRNGFSRFGGAIADCPRELLEEKFRIHPSLTNTGIHSHDQTDHRRSSTAPILTSMPTMARP